jgi:hypothetical protein
VGVRRQVYLDESDERMLVEQSRSTGLSVSELVRRALHQAYGAGPRLSWDEYFALPRPRVGSGADEPVVLDPLFDGGFDDEVERELDAVERGGPTTG